ncbi:MAG: pyridoxamine 5'-phosphate oxidase family protein [Deltaproteobacteria bacterium]|jgi:nitroimidazol reductase NimA-like FMN-containing flavoprotein (pyridoxamine 5'-phosphate oxidase superfamily)|nr:pyridoxamine 5'-phosphate oxidase family protein [Deltaproteobacteria bacterium]
MKDKWSLSQAEVEKILAEAEVGVLATLSPDGPYAVPVNYVYHQGRIYFHGGFQGQKMEFIARDPRVSFVVYETVAYRRGQTPCSVSTVYRSVVISGQARLIQGQAAEVALRRLVAKFAPALADQPIPPEKLARTAVVEIEVTRLTGKFRD